MQKAIEFVKRAYAKNRNLTVFVCIVAVMLIVSAVSSLIG